MSTRAFLAGARAALRLVASDRVATAWDEPSVLDGMSVGELAAHLARAVLQVRAYRGAPVPEGVAPVDAAGYYAGLDGTADPTSVLNTGVRERAAASAADGHAALVAGLRDAVDALAVELAAVEAQETLAVGHRRDQVLTVGEYLRTRCVELAVHLEDLALSLGCEPGAPPSTVAVAVDVLQAAARRRHGDPSVLRALAGRVPDPSEVLRVL